MCEPATIGAIVVGVSTVMQGYAAKQQGDYANSVAKYNARLSENEAIRTRNKGTEEEIRHRDQVQHMISRQRTQAAANGVNVNSGSAMLLQTDTEIVGNADALKIRSNFQDAANALDEQAKLTRAEGKAAKAGGKSAFTSSLFKAAGTVAGSGVADKWFATDSAAISELSTVSATDFTGIQGVNTARQFGGFA
tara:strand:- start:5396 stop:5974 length:579 start_codon:yes stop_codon:yes gene_type:complete